MNRHALRLSYLSIFALASCQAVTGLDGLQIVDAGERSSSSPVHGSDGQGSQAAGDTGSRPNASGNDAGCRPPPTAACDLLTQCGCKPGDHCQARAAAYAPACFVPGTLAPGSACSSPSDCPRGQTCDDRTCRAYCREDADCEAGICVSLQTKDARASTVQVCWTQCSPDEPSACGPGARCRTLQTERGESGVYCAAPADPCPTIEDGTCDDARGTGQCADGTDKRDCDCEPTLPGALCDAVVQCGCRRDAACAITRDPAHVSAACTAWTGRKRDDAACKDDAECAPGYVCQFGGTCSRLCHDDSQCSGRTCLPVVLSDKPSAGLKVCYTACDRANPSCASGKRCAHFDPRFDVVGDYCVLPTAHCPAADGVCDEARGTGLCTDDTDVIDCCQSSLPGGECNLVSQCGCEKKPGTSCATGALGGVAHTVACAAPGPTMANAWCLDDSSCARGLGCSGHVCRPYCAEDADCGQGARCDFTMRNGVTTSVKVCLDPCNPETNIPCGENTRCSTGTVQDAPATGCTFLPLTAACPIGNGRCDEPEGTGICAEASDPADCSAG